MGVGVAVAVALAVAVDERLRRNKERYAPCDPVIDRRVERSKQGYLGLRRLSTSQRVQARDFEIGRSDED